MASAHLLDGGLTGNDLARININDVVHVFASLVLVAILNHGAIGLPVGVPSPVVNSNHIAPAPTCAVTHSTSFPECAAHLSLAGWIFFPGIVEHCGEQRRVPPFLAAPADFMASVSRPSANISWGRLSRNPHYGSGAAGRIPHSRAD